MQISDKDMSFLQQRGITPENLAGQVQMLKDGIPCLKIQAPALVGKGIVRLDQDLQDKCVDTWYTYGQSDKQILKFVPASGAATRMFQDLFKFLDSEDTGELSPFMQLFFEKLDKFAFYGALEQAAKRIHGKTISELLESGNRKAIISALLSPEGLGYGNMAKGLLLFHKEEGKPERTPVAEHMAEGALYAANRSGKVHLHFTISEQFTEIFNQLVKDQSPVLFRRYGVEYDVTHSYQDPSTDTVSLDSEGELVHDNKGDVLLRPSGHGALLKNLNALDMDIIFVKNIDNVVPDRLKGDTVLYKKILAGYLVMLQQRIFTYLRLLESGKYTHAQLLDIEKFLEQELSIQNPSLQTLEDTELVIYLKSKLNRPVRVCGMVPRSGEVGGAPYLAYNPDGTISPQILEPSQVDKNDPQVMALMNEGTHFNPVDLVLSVRDYKGNKFDLDRFVDPMTAFVSQKSYQGKDIRVLERPGLWNGAMSDWNTVFVEVPLTTFNPVKTVNDLLRSQHQ